MKSSFVFRLPAIASAKVGRSYFVSVSRFAFRVACHPESFDSLSFAQDKFHEGSSVIECRHPEGVKRSKDPVGAACKRDSSSAAGGLRMTPLFCSLAMTVLLLAACGGEKGSDDDLAALQNPATNLSETQKDLAPKSADEFWKSIIYSKHYSGELLVTFQKDSDIRLRFSKFVSMSGKDMDQTNHYIQQMGAKVSRSLAQLSESQIESAVKSSMARGENFADWNLIYRIKIKNPDYAYELMNVLKDSPLVEDIQPMPIPSVSDMGITSNISGDQDYLKSDAVAGGLNVEAAWSKASGEGVIIADSEGNWNFDHED
ncbi:hypothetical protein KKA47_05735, partial [bacterium]|nr:hypothetical protein [bacterium]